MSHWISMVLLVLLVAWGLAWMTGMLQSVWMRVSEEGLHVPRIRGERLVRWADVRYAYVRGNNTGNDTIVIGADGREFLVLLGAVNNPMALADFVVRHLPATAEHAAPAKRPLRRRLGL